MHDPEGYISNLCSILRIYSLEEAETGVAYCADHCRFAPTRFELRHACEEAASPRRRAAATRAREAAQMAERAALEAPRGGRGTLADLHAEMRARGFPMGPEPHGETPASVRAKLKTTQEQWNDWPPTNATTEPASDQV
jgi:hypothetical protein